ncbi:MAG TPA: LPS export ABC transporter permease LptG [Thermoanaerobaculia bacterium]
MSILSRYIFKEMVGPTFLGLIFYTSILVMHTLFDMAGLIIKGSLSAGAVGKLLLYSLPNIVVLTIPMSLLFGILIAIGRLSSDSEIVAMRALGISTRTIYRPVLVFSVLIFLVTLYLINFVMPQGNREFVKMRAELATSAAEGVIKPRIFHDQFENLILFVNDIDPTTGHWKGVFVADNRSDSPESMTPAEMSTHLTAPQDAREVGGLSARGAGQRTIVAASGNLAIVEPSKEIWMNLQDAETHVWDSSQPDRYDHTTNASQRLLVPSVGLEPHSRSVVRSLRELNLLELVDQERALRASSDEQDRVTRNVARVEIHKKFAIPFACIAFGILGLPLGITNRRGGKSSGFSLSIAIILAYYVMISNGEQLAAAGTIPAALGMWGANLLLLGAGVYLLGRANRDFVVAAQESTLRVRLLRRVQRILPKRRSRTTDDGETPSLLSRLDITFPNILDRYVLREFLKTLALVLISVLALFIVVDYSETSKDARESGAPLAILLTYYRFHIFGVLNWALPISVLVATLVTFAMMSKNNEVTALKSNGVSLYRIALPILAVAALTSLLAYFVLDFILPHSTIRVAELKSQIKGRPLVSASAQEKLWYLGQDRYLINFLAYDRNAERLTQVQVFELHPTEFRLTRRVYARHATWNGTAWVFEDGWMRSFTDDGNSTYSRIDSPLALQYAETPDDFATDVRTPEQMTYAELRRYIGILRDSGYEADSLAVRLYEKASWPAVSLVMALIAMPFAFRMGRHGALYGIALALILAIIYWMIYVVFTKFGEVGNLPPILSAWAANILFAIAAVYLFLHVET